MLHVQGSYSVFGGKESSSPTKPEWPQPKSYLQYARPHHEQMGWVGTRPDLAALPKLPESFSAMASYVQQRKPCGGTFEPDAVGEASDPMSHRIDRVSDAFS